MARRGSSTKGSKIKGFYKATRGSAQFGIGYCMGFSAFITSKPGYYKGFGN